MIFPFRHFLQRWPFLPIYANLSLRKDDKEAWRNPSYDKETKRCFLYCNKIMKFCLDIKFIWVLMFISEDLGVIPASFPVLVSRSEKINWFLSPSLYLALQTTPYILLSNRPVLKPSKSLKFRKICSESTLLNLSDFLDNRPRWIQWVMECCSPILQMGVRCPHQRLRRKKWARWTRDMKIWLQCPTPSLKVCYV